MLAKQLKDALSRVDRGPFSPLFALGASVYHTVRRRRIHVYYVDREGHWVNWQRSTAFFSLVPHRQDARRVEQISCDHWAHRYLPRTGDVVIDVGAGIGEDSIVFSRLVGPRGRVVGIEAHPRTFACLEKAVARNRLANVTALQCAITDREQNVFISDGADEEHLLNNIVDDHRERGVRVPGRTLDSVVAELGIERVDLLKMNIEGAEKFALAGMIETLRKTRSAVISCHDFIADSGGPHSLRTRAEVHAFLEKHGFVVERREDDSRLWMRDNLYATNPRVAAR